MNDLASRYRVIDIDTHVIEPYDLWTSRMSAEKFGDAVPQVRRDEKGKDYWYFGGKQTIGAANFAQAGYREWSPFPPDTLDDAARNTWDSEHRLKLMDDCGIYAQVLFPNLVGVFGSQAIYALKDGDLMYAIIRAYNDWQKDWAEADPKRLLPQATLPVWDLDLAVAEMERCRQMGHRGIVISDTPEHFGQPRLTTKHWDKLWAAAQDMGMVVNFHIGSGNNDPMINLIDTQMAGVATASGSQATLMFMANAKALVQLIGGGICHRFPRLNFVSVESGVGWVPFIIGALEWQWQNSNVWAEHPDWLTPLEYFQRQIYASFWFELPKTLYPAIEFLGYDNVLYETDFPHPTSMSTGPCSAAKNPRVYMEEIFSGLPEVAARKILHDNAARIYQIE